ncbi:B9 domain-containing protein 2 [Homalodisca vitripennis]|nr:B9 domain-containing protein 2 [Homalodisca vitripennis]
MEVVLMFCLLVIPSISQNVDQVGETTTDLLCSNGTEDSCEAFNSTEIPTTSAAEATTATTSSKKSKTPTAKTVNKKPLPVFNNTTPSRPQPDCTCDLTRGGCEINCCCDVDCGPEHRAVFTHCIALPPIVDSDYCFPTQLLYRNNSNHQTVETDPGVLCVVQQNTFASTDFTDIPVITTKTAFNKKLGRRRYYSWPNLSLPSTVFDTETPFRDGSPVWITDNVTISRLGVPVSIGHSTLCHGTVEVTYLTDTETSCTKPLTTKAECHASTEAQFFIISSPHSYNFTQPQDCTEDVCIPLHNYICSDACIERTLPKPVFNDTTNICHNLIETLEYKIYHNGSRGIVDVKGYYTLRNLSVHRDQLVRKRYKVTYLWAGSSDQQVFRRSGSPGYDRGKPVISGRRSLKAVTYNFSMSDWISVGVTGGSGYCRDRYNLLFAENIRTQCSLTVKGTCKQIQQQIWQQILGPVANLSEAVISSYGDPKEGEVEAWVPLLSAEPPPVPALTTAVDIIIVYSLVGPVARPQAKIIAAYLDLLPSANTCESNHTTVVVETSVRFIDKTTPAVTKFAQPPVYEIKLPQDFFYPFLSAGSGIHPSKEIMLLVVIFYNVVGEYF